MGSDDYLSSTSMDYRSGHLDKLVIEQILPIDEEISAVYAVPVSADQIETKRLSVYALALVAIYLRDDEASDWKLDDRFVDGLVIADGTKFDGTIEMNSDCFELASSLDHFDRLEEVEQSKPLKVRPEEDDDQDLPESQVA